MSARPRPLIAEEAFGQTDSDFEPHFIIDGQYAVLDPPQITGVPQSVLGPPVLPLAANDNCIINAIDALLSRTRR